MVCIHCTIYPDKIILFEIRDNFDESLFEVRQDRGNQIDFTKQFSTIINP